MKIPQTPKNFLQDGHLGGTSIEGDPQSWHPELWDWFINNFAIASMLDIGCGCGYTQGWFNEKGVLSYGMDGCQLCIDNYIGPSGMIFKHDLTSGIFVNKEKCDLVWCCELAEHINPDFVQNVIDTIKVNCNKVCMFCAATPGWNGHHHVNCQDVSYWIDKISDDNCVYNDELTIKARSVCKDGQYFKRSGLIFKCI